MIHWSPGTSAGSFSPRPLCYLSRLPFSHFLYLSSETLKQQFEHQLKIYYLITRSLFSLPLPPLASNITSRRHGQIGGTALTRAAGASSSPSYFTLFHSFIWFHPFQPVKRRFVRLGAELPNAAGNQSDRHSLSVSDAETQLSVSSQILHNMQQES